MARRTYRSMQGKIVDMELLSQANELAPAIGNMRVNARGDELGPGGKIIRKREDIMSEYYDRNPSSVKDEQFVKKAIPAVTPPAPEKVKETSKRNTPRKRTTNENKTDS